MGDLDPSMVMSCVRTEEINGEHSLSLSTVVHLYIGMRILMQDTTGKWREYVVDEEDEEHSSGRNAIGTYHAMWSIQYDLSTTAGGVQWASVEEGTNEPVTASNALAAALTDSVMWRPGTCDVVTLAAASFYDNSCWEYLSIIVETWGGEIDAEITVDDTGVVTRKVALMAHLGSSTAKRRFDWGRDLTRIRRIPDPGPYYCRVVPRGGSEGTDSDGVKYSDRCGIESENDGIPYLQDDEAAELFKTLLPDGTWFYPTKVVNYQLDTKDDAEELYNKAVEDLYNHTRPNMSYEADVVQLAIAGLNIQGIALGDDVQCVDNGFGDIPLRIQGRVVSMTVNEMNPSDTTLTIGRMQHTLTDEFTSLTSTVGQVSSRVTLIESGGTSAYVRSLIDRMNQEINATDGWTYIVPDEGIIVYDIEVDDPIMGYNSTLDEYASSVVQIKGGGIRIANTRKPEFAGINDWDWKSVFDAGHIAAELVTAVNMTTGFIGNASSGTFIDLDNDVVRIGTTAQLGGRSVLDILDGIDATVTDVDVQFAENQSADTAPTTGWTTTAPAYREGYYIWQRTATTTAGGTTYSDPTCISGRDGTDGTNGVGISSTTITYGTSDSAATQPSSWSSTAPTNIQQGKWLWCKTVYTYSDGSTKTTYTKSYVGTDGEDGTSVYVQSASKTGDTTTVVIADSDGHTNTLSIVDGTDGTDGTPGTDGLNGYVHVAWATSADGSQGFSTSVSAGKTYLGTYTDNVQADSQSYADYSWSLIKGTDGQDGTDGTNGVGISSTTITYGTSDSAATQPSSWSSTAPTNIQQGKWLWCKTVYTYSDGSTKTTYTKSYVGTDGEDGTSVYVQSASKTGDTTTVVIADSDGHTNTLSIVDGTDGTDGTPGTDGLNGYVHVAWATSADGSQGFSTSVSAGKTYLGTYTDNVQADSQSYADYSWSLIKGTDGQDGTDGKGISSVVEQYYLSTSSSTQTGGSWSDTPAAYVSGRYYWTRTIITWSDNTTTTTTPVIARAINSANENALDARKVATNYLTFNSTTGLDVGYAGTSAKTRVNGSGVEIFDGDGRSAVLINTSGERIGHANEARLQMDYHSMYLVDKSNVKFFEAIDYRGTNSIADVTVEIRKIQGVTGWLLPHLVKTVQWVTSGGSRVPSSGTNCYTVTNSRDGYSVFGLHGTYANVANGTVIKIKYTTEQAFYSYLMGSRAANTAAGHASLAQGQNVAACGWGSHAEGQNTSAIGSWSHTEGYNTKALSNCDHAEGGDTTASGGFSHAEGRNSNATGIYSHAEGQTAASGMWAHSEGSGTGASGLCSHSEGGGTTASAEYSHAQNRGTIAASACQTAIGRYNLKDTSNAFAFVIGNGTPGTANTSEKRSNAFAIRWDGSAPTQSSNTGFAINTTNVKSVGTQAYRRCLGVVQVAVGVTVKVAVAKGKSIVLGKLPAGYRPAQTAIADAGSFNRRASIATNGDITLKCETAVTSKSWSVTIRAVFLTP